MEADGNMEPFDSAISTSDVVMLLRIQHERHADKLRMTREEYHARFGMTLDRVRTMKRGAILMHPAPFNRGVEIADEAVECGCSRIFKQVENGMFLRMAALDWVTRDA